MNRRPNLLRRLLPCLPALLLAACGFGGEPAAASGSPPPEVLRALSRGVNLSTWFTDRDSPNIRPQRWFADGSDFRLIQRLGLRHVRIPVSPAFLEDPKQPAALREDRLAELRQAIAQAQTENLLVIVALQPSSEIKQRLSEEPTLVALEAFWRALAKALAPAPASLLMFEALNEPELEDAQRSRLVMQRLVAAIRSVAPRHTVVVAGHKYSGVEELAVMQPLPDINLIYAFHFYEPHNFTHQGATWGWPMWAKFANWPYPSSPEAVAHLLDAAPPETREHLAWYGEQRWNRAKLGEWLDKAGLWAARHEVPIWCNEFGAVRDAMPPEARRAWLTDAREMLEARRIPWSHWDYAGHFGLVTGDRGSRSLDPDALAGLGLIPR
jgi:aryl-phospho-beta-D-glucosidase BglC (GH1 family)